MQYEIFGNSLPAVNITLEQGESIFTESGGMTWMTDGIAMETNMKGGFGKAIGRMFTGESLFMATYTAQVPKAQITMASSFPGSCTTASPFFVRLSRQASQMDARSAYRLLKCGLVLVLSAGAKAF